MTHRRFQLVAALLAGLAAGSARADINLGFDADAQGLSASFGGTLSWQASGGNGGGFLQITDVTGEDMELNLPGAVLGNWSAYLDGRFAFDARNLNGETSNWDQFGTLTLFSGSSSVVLDFVPLDQPPPDGQWHRYGVQLSSANFGASLPTVLSNVTAVTLGVENHNGVTEIVGIDNVSVSAVPEPASTLLALGGLALLAGALRRRRS